MEAKEIHDYLIDGEGRFYRRYQSLTEIEINPAVTAALAGNTALKIRSVLDLKDYGIINLVHTPKDNRSYWTVPIQKINFRCEFRPFERGGVKLLSPQFIYKPESPTIMSITWNKTNDEKGNMPQIYMMIQMDGLFVEKQYLYSLNDKGQAFQLPISNLYNTCELCNGDFARRATTHIGCVEKAIQQFENSQWNSDLYEPDEGTANMFSFKPLEKGFETQPIVGVWTDWCMKVANTNLDYLLP